MTDGIDKTLEIISSDTKRLYIEMVKKCVGDSIYWHLELVPVVPHALPSRAIIKILASRGLEIVRRKPVDQQARMDGKDWPLVAHTMIGKARLDNLQYCLEDVLNRGVPGDVIETGVWRGGAAIVMRAILKAYGVKDRRVWVADSFSGLPPPNPIKYPQDSGDIHHTFKELAVSLGEVQANFERYGLLDDQVVILKGWFSETLPGAPIQKLAVMRLDGDMYESTMDALSSLYHRLLVGGYVIIDDYGAVRSCKEAVTDFREANGIKDELITVDWSAVYWKRCQ